jgi:Peptidase family S41
MCNGVGQVYYGPVVLITDALCYSTTDIFAAGFQDHEIGPVIGSGNTGAGGANVWGYADVMRALPGRFEPLPKQASMRVAIRRTTRVGARADDPLEDVGVVSDIVHRMTRRDLLERNVNLIARAAQVLDGMPRRALTMEIAPSADGIDIAFTTAGLDRVDFYVDERPRATVDVTDGSHAQTLALVAGEPHTIELRGFSAGELAAGRKLERDI